MAYKRRPAKRRSDRVDMYEVVTTKIIEKLQEGVVPWRQPWRSASGALPRSMETGNAYRGVNQLLLSLMPYASPWWGTKRQINDKGGLIGKGQRHTKLVLWRIRRVVDEATEEVRRIPLLKVFLVWNAEQCVDLKLPHVDDTPPDFEPEAAAEAIIDNMPGRPRIVFGSHQAAYAAGPDRIELPPREAFDSAGGFYATAFHELGHSTGHKKRLDRAGIVNGPCFGSESYSDEELVAEFASAMLCAEARVEGTLPDSASYIDGWLNVLGGDKRLAVVAAGRAQRAADFILGRSFDDAEEATDTEGESDD